MRRTCWIEGMGAAALLATLAGLPDEAAAQERRFFQVAPGARLEQTQIYALNEPATGLSLTGGSSVIDRDSIRRWLCPNGGTPMRGRPGRCDGRGVARAGAASAGGGVGRYGQDPDVVGWFADLPRASGRQTACPEGTTAAEARSNPGTVRCIPG